MASSVQDSLIIQSEHSTRSSGVAWTLSPNRNIVPTAISTSEPPIMPRVALGDSAAVRECIERYGPLIHTMACRFLGRGSDAEDAVQEVFIELWKHAPRFNPVSGSEWTFVTVITRRRLIDCRRRLVRRPQPTELIDGLATRRETDSVSLATHDEVTKARHAIDQLRAEQRQVILLSVDQGLTHQEIATHTGIPVGTVKTHIRRGLSKVRELLTESPAGDCR